MHDLLSTQPHSAGRHPDTSLFQAPKMYSLTACLYRITLALRITPEFLLHTVLENVHSENPDTTCTTEDSNQINVIRIILDCTLRLLTMYISYVLIKMCCNCVLIC